MVLSLPLLLSLFTLLALSSGVYFLSERTKLPYTVLLVAVGTFILVPLSSFPIFSFIRAFTFTPEVLFYLFLPILIFDSAYNMSIRRLLENIWTISALSIISLLISAGTIGGVLFFLFPVIGFHIPLILCVLFGALISATDPVAVLALFKELGAPRRLTLIFEGESIFNDGTAVALFLIILSIVADGWHGSASLIHGVSMFVSMIVSGILLGLLFGRLFAKAVEGARQSEYVQISLMIVLAHLTFIISDYLSENIIIFGYHLYVSAIISTAVASMVMGNYGSAKIPPHAREFVDKFWTQSALLANSLVFLLIGLIFTSLPVNIGELLLPISITVLVVAAARAVSIYLVAWVLNRSTLEATIPSAWQHLLAWGSLRGALAITMVLLIPEDLMVSGWSLAYSPREFIFALTIGCVFATLFIKATTIKALARKLRTSDFTALEQLQYGEALALVHTHALARLNRMHTKGYVDTRTADLLSQEHRDRLTRALVTCKKNLETQGSEHGERVLKLYAIGIEKKRLADLYEYGEVTEHVYRQVHAKLIRQHDRIEFGIPLRIDQKRIRGMIARTARFLRFAPAIVSTDSVLHRYIYYRTLVVLANATIRELHSLDPEHSVQLFGEDATKRVIDLYESFLSGSNAKMKVEREREPALCSTLDEHFARRSILEVESRTLDELHSREMITPKVYLDIKASLDRTTETLEDACSPLQSPR